VPTWAWHEHQNRGSQDAVLFSIEDTPVFKALGWFREEEHPQGRQRSS
ncbi:MAG: cupin, partial [Chloroflexi bacterium]|nr:cupin [Chloroflexota bacterium]